MDHDTRIGGANDRFPVTRGSVLAALRAEGDVDRQRGLAVIVQAYWKPIYKYIRLHWRADNEEAKDLTQSFFESAMQRGFFERYVQQKAAFRTYMRLCVDGYVANQRQAAQRIKRGGGRLIVSLDFPAADKELGLVAGSGDGPADAHFDREYLRSLFDCALRALREECNAEGKGVHFALFERYDLAQAAQEHRVTYDALAAEFKLPVTQITNYLAWARRSFRAHVLSTLRELCGSEDEFRDEARMLLGVQV